MTDDQLRAMARRVLELVAHRDDDGYWGMDTLVGTQDEVESEAVAILREEMGKAGELQTGWTYSTGTVQADDPTQTIVIDV